MLMLAFPIELFVSQTSLRVQVSLVVRRTDHLHCFSKTSNDLWTKPIGKSGIHLKPVELVNVKGHFHAE